MKRKKYTFEMVTNESINNTFVYWFRVRHRNGQVIMTSETYTTKAKCKRSMMRLIEAMIDSDYEVKQ